MFRTLSAFFSGHRSTRSLVEVEPDLRGEHGAPVGMTPICVAEYLVEKGRIPATRKEVLSAFEKVTGREPRAEEAADAIAVADSFGWYAD